MDTLYLQDEVTYLLQDVSVVFEKNKKDGRTEEELKNIDVLYERTRSLISEINGAINRSNHRRNDRILNEELKTLQDWLDYDLVPVRRRLYGVLYYHANKKTMLRSARKWEIENPELRNSQPNRDKKSLKVKRRKFYICNQAKEIERAVQYRENNRKEINDRRRKQDKAKRESKQPIAQS